MTRLLNVGKWSFTDFHIDASYMLPKAEVDAAQNALQSNTYQTMYDEFTKRAICPPDGIVVGAKVSDSLLGAAATVGKRQTIDGTLDKVAFMRFIAGSGKESRGALTFEVRSPAQLKKTAERAGWVPIYWLPWLSANIVEMTMDTGTDRAKLARPSDDNTIDPIDEPKVFFTAAINGCSVFVTPGTDGGLTVKHAGFTGSLKQQFANDRQNWKMMGGNSADAWRYLTGANALQAGTYGEVNSNDYIKAGAARRADKLKQKLNKNRQFHFTQVSPQGCVFGLKNTTNQWEFFLQKNMLIAYQKYVATPEKFGPIPYTKQTPTQGKVPKLAERGGTFLPEKRIGAQEDLVDSFVAFVKDYQRAYTEHGDTLPDQPTPLDFTLFDYQKVVTVTCDKFYPGANQAVLNIGKNAIIQMLY
jgi:hypothetical protein